MSQELSEEKLIKSYFLGELPESEQEQILDRLLSDHDFFETSLIVEGELVDDYALGMISDQDRVKLERGLLMSSHEYQQVEFIKTLNRYIVNNKVIFDSGHALESIEEGLWERLLGEAQDNRNLIWSVMTDNWLGLELLLQLKRVPRVTQSELASHIVREDAAITEALTRLLNCGLVNETAGRYLCSSLGSEILEKINELTDHS